MCMYLNPIPDRNVKTHQLNGVVVDFSERVVDGHCLDLELHTMEAELTRNVRASKLHVHGNKLHGADTASINSLNEVWKLLNAKDKALIQL